jgi:hypothetical protein
MSNEVTVIEQNPNDTAMYLMTKAEVDTQIATAHAFPRSLKTFMDEALSMATISEDIAQSCTYAMPRGGKPIEGPSVRLAEIVTSAYGNARAGARVIDNDGKTVTAQGIFHDLQKNVCITVEVKRSIMQHEWANGAKTGRMIKMNDDMQVVIGNAACAIAFRNAVFKGVPAALVTSIYDQVKQVAKGTAQTLVERRTKAVEWFTEQGIKPAQICKSLSIKKVEDIDLDKLSMLSGMRSAVKNGESTLKELFEAEAEQKEKKKPALTPEQLTEAIQSIAMDNVPVSSITDEFEVTPEQLKQLTDAVG